MEKFIITVGVVIFLIAAFLLSALLIQWLVNIVLSHYDLKVLDYGTSMAVTGLVWLSNGFNFRSKDK